MEREEGAEVELRCLEELDLADVDLNGMSVSVREVSNVPGVLNVRAGAGRYPGCSSQSHDPSPPG